MLTPSPSIYPTTLGTIIFCVSYAVFAFGRIPGTKIDRTAMAIIGGTAMVAFGVLSPQRALAGIDFPTLILLIAMMLLAGGLHEAGFFSRLVHRVIAHVQPNYLLPAVLFTSGILSALLINDVVCVILTPLVLKITHHMKKPALPYLLALATASNIGSTATITGNPQNILIASVSSISYIDFLLHLGPVAVLGLLADWALLYLLFRKQLNETVITKNDEGNGFDPYIEPRKLIWPLLVTIAVSVSLLYGVQPALAAACGASLLLIRRKADPRILFSHINLALLIFFIGLFVVLAGGEAVGIHNYLLGAAEHLNLRNTAIFTVVITLLSNAVSNVPAVMLLKPFVMGLGNTHAEWLLLAMASTLAGNLTITGSVANIIVVENAQEEAPISFWQYLRIGVPVTAVTLLIGWLWLTFLTRFRGLI
jgi:Na+/H+ antiporter NhaD/arsenite permease-like protein